MTDPKPDPALDAAYSLSTPDDNRALYKTWADTYEEDFIGPSGYVYHHNVAELFAREAGAQTGAVLDVGCGTGIVGPALHQRGYDVIDGIDISPEMLSKSAEKGVYRDLTVADLTEPLNIEPDQYIGAVSVGTFTHGHVGPEALPRVVALGAAGAVFAIGVNAEFYEERGFAATIGDMVDSGLITQPAIEQVRIYENADHEHVDDLAMTLLFRRV